MAQPPSRADSGGARLVALSDTHFPRRAKDLPAPLWAAIDAADVVVHAGDWCTADLLDTLEARVAGRGGVLLGVAGNNDGPDLWARLPEVARAEIAGVRIAVVHETGQAIGREARCARTYPDTDVLFFGHSHIPWDTTADSGLRLLNPGSPTDKRRQPHHTYLTAEIRAGTLHDVVLHRL
jgi:putative phosphoesterase